jgi:hypothetical protein
MIRTNGEKKFMKINNNNKKLANNINNSLIQFYLEVLLCFKFRKDKFIAKAQEKINLYLDSCHYIKKMHELELIKSTIFSEEQIKLFNFIACPAISLKNKNCQVYKSLYCQPNIFERKYLFNICEIRNKLSESQFIIDKNLCNYLDLEVANIKKIHK